MPFIDEKGRILGKLNVIDLFVVALICLISTLGYLKLTAPHRVASPYPTSSNTKWITIELRLSDDKSWLIQKVVPGALQLDGRSGKPNAEIISATDTKNEGPMVIVKVLASVDPQGRLVFGPALLVPGRELRIETSQCIVEGLVAAVHKNE